MAFLVKGNFKSILGRQIGITKLSSALSGGTGGAELLTGPDQFACGVSTAESTGTRLKAYGVSVCSNTSAGSSSVYVLDPPIPGVMKSIWLTSANTNVYLKTANAETFVTSADSTITTVLASTIGGYCINLIGITTGLWGLVGGGSSAISYKATT